VQQLRPVGALVGRTLPALWGEVTKQPPPHIERRGVDAGRAVDDEGSAARSEE